MIFKPKKEKLYKYYLMITLPFFSVSKNPFTSFINTLFIRSADQIKSKQKKLLKSAKTKFLSEDLRKIRIRILRSSEKNEISNRYKI